MMARNRSSNLRGCDGHVLARHAAANPMCLVMSRGRRSLIRTRVFDLPVSISYAVTRCSRAGPMGTAQEFIALLTCADWQKLWSEGGQERLSDSCSKTLKVAWSCCDL